MKRALLISLTSFLVLTAVGAFAAEEIAQDVQDYANCQYCGMNRQQFAHSRMLIEYDDQSVMGACSIHCAAVDLAVNIDKTPKEMKVGDFKTKNLIDADKAHWVIGGNKPGVMSKRAKWAFEKKEDSEQYIKENGGTLASFDDAMKATYEDMYSDTKMIREKRAMKRQQAGQEQKGAAEHKHQ